MLAIIDYNAGNQTSVKRALTHLGIESVITRDAGAIASAQGIIFPGVGAAGQAMREIASRGLDLLLAEQVAQGRPLLGICVGCQVLLDYSLENDTKTLGIIPGRCEVFNPNWEDEGGLPIKIPHMGWNSITPVRQCRLLDGIEPEAEFYFVHSYYPDPAPEYVLATTTYGRAFCSMHGRDGLWAVQFHPEKSGRPGLKLLTNFNAYCQEASSAQ